MATIKSMHILWRQTKNFSLDRENIGNQYIFLYFQTPNIVLTKNGNAYTRGNSFIIHDKYSHQYFKAVEKDLLHDWMHIEGSLDSIMKKAQLEYNVLYEIPNGSFITKIMHDLELEFLNPDTYSPALINLNIDRLFMLLGRAVNIPKTLSINSDAKFILTDARTQIHMTYYEKWTVESMADLTHYSTSRFCVLYKQLFGVSPKKDLKNTRIERAIHLLTYTTYSLKEIAEMIGYETEYYFIRTFKEITGKTPRGYLK